VTSQSYKSRHFKICWGHASRTRYVCQVRCRNVRQKSAQKTEKGRRKQKKEKKTNKNRKKRKEGRKEERKKKEAGKEGNKKSKAHHYTS